MKRRSNYRSMLAALVVTFGCLLATSEATAQIQVTGTGEATAPASAASLSIRVSGNGPLAADAGVKFRDAKTQAITALRGADLANMTIVEKGQVMSVVGDPQQMMRMMQGQMDNAAGLSPIQIEEVLECTIANLDKQKDAEVTDQLLQLLDTARTANLRINSSAPSNILEMQMLAMSGEAGSSSVLTFTPAEPDALRRKAYAKAIENARAKATELAQLAGVKLGRIEAISTAPASTGNMGIAQLYLGIGASGSGGDDESVTGTLSQITMTVNLNVTFAVE